MTLLDIRTQVVKESGRYDLVVDTTTFADNGMDKYINAGMIMLDRMVDIPDSEARLFYAPTTGEYTITIPSDCRSIHNIWVNDDETRWELTKLEPDVFKEEYSGLVSATDAGPPKYFTLIDQRSLAPTNQGLLGDYFDKTAVEGSSHGVRGIVFAPKTDTTYVFEVIGLFKQITLSSDSDSNFWTEKETDLLVRAAMYKLEVHSRGTENAKNWLSAIRDDVRMIDYDIAAEESYGINQLRG